MSQTADVFGTKGNRDFQAMRAKINRRTLCVRIYSATAQVLNGKITDNVPKVSGVGADKEIAFRDDDYQHMLPKDYIFQPEALRRSRE